MKYIIVSPVKDESKHISITINSVINQTLLPDKWIIVDDGSLDNTSEIVESFSKKYSWIQLIKNPSQNEIRSGGSKVVKAFNKGYKEIKDDEFDFIVKLDGDLELPSNYFAEISKQFDNDPYLGLCGGVILNKYGDNFIEEKSPDYHIRGAFKAIRKGCFDDIGGFKETWNWDGLDEMEAMYKGWKTKVIKELKVKHFRPTTAAYNKKKHSFKSGVEAYKMRSCLLLTIGRALKLMKEKPYIINTVYYLFGYFKGFVTNEDRLINKELGRFINRFHRKRLFGI